MSKIKVNQVPQEKAKQTLPIFEEIGNQMEAVRRRAFDLFRMRGEESGHDLEDWLQAERDVLGWSAAELSEKNGNIEAQITLPGFDAKDVEVTSTPSELIIHASAAHEAKGDRKGAVWSEFGSKDIYRRFELPRAIQVDKVSAKLEKGILTVTAPVARHSAAAAA